MSDVAERFKRYSQEHARLYDPELLEASARIAPVEETGIAQAAGKTRGKKKKKRGAKPSRRPAGEDRPEAVLGDVSDLDADDPLDVKRWLPAVYQSPLVRVTDDEPPPEAADAEAALPAIIASPLRIRRRIALFQEQRFAVNAPDAQKVFMLWSRQPHHSNRRVEMEHQRDGLFNAAVSMEDGVYLLAYEINGVTRPDPRYTRCLVVRPEGVYARLGLSRNLVPVELANEGNRDESLRLKPTVPWLAVEDELPLPAGRRAQANVRLLPERMAQGRNEGVLLATTERRGEEFVAATIRADVALEVGGAVPEFHYHPQDLGWIVQGDRHVEFTVEIDVRGQGPLTGMVFLPNPGEVAEFRLEAGGEPARFTRRFVIDSRILPYKTEGQLKVVLITDSFLADQRFFEIALPYRLVYLKKSLPALAFGKVRQGVSRTLRLEVERSDGREIDLEVAIPPAAAAYLECYRARAGVYSLRLDATRLAAGTAINETLALSDRNSDLQDEIKVIAEIVDEAARTALRA